MVRLSMDWPSSERAKATQFMRTRRCCPSLQNPLQKTLCLLTAVNSANISRRVYGHLPFLEYRFQDADNDPHRSTTYYQYKKDCTSS